MLYDKIKKHNVKVWIVNTGYNIIYVDGLKANMDKDIESHFINPRKYSTPLIMVIWTMLKLPPLNTSISKCLPKSKEFQKNSCTLKWDGNPKSNMMKLCPHWLLSLLRISKRSSRTLLHLNSWKLWPRLLQLFDFVYLLIVFSNQKILFCSLFKNALKKAIKITVSLCSWLILLIFHLSRVI